MRGIDFGLGVPLGLVVFYGLSLASAFWIAPIPNYYVWGLLLSAATCCLAGLALAVRPSIALVATGTMLILVIIGFATGSNIYLSVPPFPGALPQLFFHGARSAVVIGPLALLATTATIRVVTHARARRVEPVESE